MGGEPQLERSVLEGKERDKLQAIAEALGLKPTARTKKADLIDGILRATGVEAGPATGTEAARPKRATRKRAAATVEAADGGDQGDVGTLELVDPAEDRAPVAPADAPGAAEVAAASEPAAAATAAEPAVSAAPEPPAPSTGTDQRPGPAFRPDGDEQASRNGGDPSGSGAAPARPPQAPRPAPPPGSPGPGNHANPPGQNHQPAPAPPPGQNGPQQQGAPGEGGEVRRNRRRRGRDRDRLSAGYDQQAQQADQAYSGEPIPCDGLLELRPEGFGFLRTSGYLTGPDDVYVSMSQVRRFALRAGDRIVGASRPATTQERFGALLRIDSIGDQSPDEARGRPRFDDLTPVFPTERLTLELADPSDPAATTGRIIDLLAPIGKGQRGVIVSPPVAGRTTVLKDIARAVEANHPDVDLMVVLVDERPEEVTDIRRSVKGEVIVSTFDRPPEEHTHVAELAVEVAKRRVEQGRDVVVVLDGITRLSRAYNLVAPAGRSVSDGLDGGALHPPKRLLAAARNLEEGGSLTILATLTLDPGSAVDTAVLEEVSGTANMELRLDRRLAERRMHPPIDVARSATEHEDLLLGGDELRRVGELRRALADAGDVGPATKAYELLLDRLRKARTNADLLGAPARTP